MERANVNPQVRGIKPQKRNQLYELETQNVRLVRQGEDGPTDDLNEKPMQNN